MFHLKKFSLEDNLSSMKIGTDSILLGASVNTNKSERILDIGTGCGIIALMLAQKSNAIIDAVEIDHNSCIQASENFQICPWMNRLTIIEADLKDFVLNCKNKYSLIVSNPPYFDSGMRTSDHSRSRARHTDSLTFGELCRNVSEILDPPGSFAVIVPESRILEFISSANQAGLLLQKVKIIHTFFNEKPVRFIAEFSFNKISRVKFDRLILRNSDRSFSEQYRKLVKDFMLDRF